MDRISSTFTLDGDSLKLIEPKKLYNMLQQGTSTCSRLTDPNYLLLLDARIKSEYNEAHLMTAKKAPKNEQGFFMVPYDADVEFKQNVVVYDNKTTSITKNDGLAVTCASMLWQSGSKHPVMILQGGYAKFSALYPFLRTQKIMYMPRELSEIKSYPVEIISGLLYLGTWDQAHTAYMQKDMKIKAHINMCVKLETYFKTKDPQLLHIPVEDSNEVELFSSFERACSFIDQQLKKKNQVLVFSTLGISRSATIVIAYLMKRNTWPLELAYQHVLECQSAVRPNRAFVKQLSMWEEQMFGACSTNIEDPNF